MTALVAETAEEILGPGAIVETRTMGGEDMSVYLRKVPGCFFFVIGATGGLPAPPLPGLRFRRKGARRRHAAALEASARRISRWLR